uniref:Receptor ligand binding region domain-containing protein n=1 Tax=Plectus sambesii TaxID=2011161 RepID=A0A914WYR8_9BILA
MKLWWNALCLLLTSAALGATPETSSSWLTNNGTYEVGEPSSANLTFMNASVREIKISYLAAFPSLSADLYRHLLNHQDGAGGAGVIFEPCYRVDFQGPKISGALAVAVDEINADPLILPGYRLNYTFENTCGQVVDSVYGFMKHWKEGAKVFIGPETNCRTEATMAAAQNLPIISYKCKDHKQESDKDLYKTFARTIPATTEIIKAFFALLKQMNWRKFTLVFVNDASGGELHSAIKVSGLRNLRWLLVQGS